MRCALACRSRQPCSAVIASPSPTAVTTTRRCRRSLDVGSSVAHDAPATTPAARDLDAVDIKRRRRSTGLTAMAAAHRRRDTLYVAEQDGRRARRSATGSSSPTPVLDLRDG